MMNHAHFLDFIFQADTIVKTIMFILLISSLISWTLILQRSFLLKSSQKEAHRFEKRFWARGSLPELFHEIGKDSDGLQAIFRAGFEEWNRLKSAPPAYRTAALENIQRAMAIAEAESLAKLESQISLLATIGSVCPYVGLLGTVWGIMSSFQGLGSAQQATLAQVAPGISEALITTAMGLFAAIPAVIAYNRFSNRVNAIAGQYGRFQDIFINLVNRQWIVQSPSPSPITTPSSLV